MKKISKQASALIMLPALMIFLNLTLFVTTAQGNIININGTLQEPDCLSIRYSDAHYTDLFTFTLTSPDNIILDASSEQEGLCLYLYDLSNPSGAELIYNKCDDVYPFSPFIGTLTNPIPLGSGTYSVELTTNDRKEAVAYTLSLNTLISSSTELNQVACSSYSYPGTLQATDCLSIRYSDAHYTDLYTFTLTTPTVVVLDASSEQEGVCLYMYDWSKPSGSELIASNCNDTYPFISKINKYLGAGTYTIELATDDPKIALEYAFASSVELSQLSCASYSYPGTLQESDWSSIRYSDTHYTDLYTFNLSSPTVVVLDAASEQEGVCLYMYDWSKPSGSELIASSCNDTYPFIAKINKFLGAGTYSIELTTDDPKITLGYMLRSSVPMNQIESSLYSYPGTLQEPDCLSFRYSDAHYKDLYSFTLTDPTVVVFDASSEQEGLCIYLADQSQPSGSELVASNCDNSYPFIAQINKYLGAGTYSLELTTNDRKVVADYAINSSVELSQLACTSYSYPGTLQASDWSSIHYTDTHYTDLYTFTLTNPNSIVLDASSQQKGLCIYMYDGSTPSESELIASNCDNSYPFIAKMNKSLPAGTYSIELTTNDPVIELDYILCTSLALTPDPTITTTTIPNSTTTTTTIETDCPLTVENSFLPLRAGLFARLRRIVIKAANAQWDETSQVTIDDINTIIQRGKDQETIIAWIIIPGKLIANFEPGPKVVLVQTPGKDDCIGEIVIE